MRSQSRFALRRNPGKNEEKREQDIAKDHPNKLASLETHQSKFQPIASHQRSEKYMYLIRAQALPINANQDRPDKPGYPHQKNSPLQRFAAIALESMQK